MPWHPRTERDIPPRNNGILCLTEWRPRDGQVAPTEVWYDSPVSFDPPAHEARLVMRSSRTVEVRDVLQRPTPPPPRPRANYTNSQYRERRKERLGDDYDHGLCVFCKQPAKTVQHITYRHAGGDERIEELRSLCRLCHDAVTMIEYGLGMGLDRINPENPDYRDRIIAKRQEIIEFRSLETRRRRLAPEEVE